MNRDNPFPKLQVGEVPEIEGATPSPQKFESTTNADDKAEEDTESDDKVWIMKITFSYHFFFALL